MKYIKTYEDYKYIDNIKIDDYIVLLNADNYDVRHGFYDGEIYTISRILDNESNESPYSIKNTDNITWLKRQQFRLATPEEIEQYKLEQLGNKYNIL